MSLLRRNSRHPAASQAGQRADSRRGSERFSACTARSGTPGSGCPASAHGDRRASCHGGHGLRARRRQWGPSTAPPCRTTRRPGARTVGEPGVAAWGLPTAGRLTGPAQPDPRPAGLGEEGPGRRAEQRQEAKVVIVASRPFSIARAIARGQAAFPSSGAPPARCRSPAAVLRSPRRVVFITGSPASPQESWPIVDHSPRAGAVSRYRPRLSIIRVIGIIFRYIFTKRRAFGATRLGRGPFCIGDHFDRHACRLYHHSR